MALPAVDRYLRAGTLSLPALPPLSLYVHLPWCLKKCPYCDFNSHEIAGTRKIALPGETPAAASAAAVPEARYLQALCADLESALPLVWGRPVVSVFIGGGTPSLFSPDSIDRLLADIRARLPLVPDCEITLEANPGTFERDRFRAFRAAGVTRLSVGVQSFDDERLHAIGRVHDAAQAHAAVEEARRCFDTFNIDLMYALPGQTLAQLCADLDTALAYAPPHLSLYHLTLEPNTVFATHPPAHLPDDDAASDMLDAVIERTAAAGLQRYEVSAFAREGHRCRHNLNYWQFGDYLGIGAGAHGKLSFPHRVMRQVRWREPKAYMEQALAGQAMSNEHQLSRRRTGVRVHAQCAAPARRFFLQAVQRTHRVAAVGDRSGAAPGRRTRPARGRPGRRPRERARLRFPQRSAGPVPAAGKLTQTPRAARLLPRISGRCTEDPLLDCPKDRALAARHKARPLARTAPAHSSSPPAAQGLELEQALQLLRQSGHDLPAGDVSDPAWLQALINSLVDMSSRDALTGLANRRSFDLALAREVDRVARAGEPALLLALDIDLFKQVNDTHGHPNGDLVLKAVAAALLECVRPMDLVARVGGEEFAIIMPNCASSFGQTVAERVRRRVESTPVAIGLTQHISVSISVGGAFAPQWVRSSATLWKERADAQLYLAKAQGRNRVCMEPATVSVVSAEEKALLFGISQFQELE